MGKIRMHLPLRQDGLTCPLPPLGRLLQSRRERRPRPNRKNVAHANLPLMPMFEFHARSLPAVVLTKNRCILTIETKNSIVSTFNICYLSATGDSGRSVGPMGTTASWPTALLPNAPAAPELRRGASAARPRPMPIWPSSRRPRRWARCRRLCPPERGSVARGAYAVQQGPASPVLGTRQYGWRAQRTGRSRPGWSEHGPGGEGSPLRRSHSE